MKIMMQFSPASSTTTLRKAFTGNHVRWHAVERSEHYSWRLTRSFSQSTASAGSQKWSERALTTSTPCSTATNTILPQSTLTNHNSGRSYPSTSPNLRVNLSTAAAVAEDLPPSSSTKQRRTTRKNLRSRDPLIVTPAAAARIQFLISRHNDSGGSVEEGKAIGIRLGTKKRGCNGLSYTLNYAYEDHMQKHGRDEAMTVEENGLKVFVEPMALMNVIGTTMDFVDDEMSSEFTFTNPNSKGECGCGESFNV